MHVAEAARLREEVERLLWMIARYDVENLTDQRQHVLCRLRAAESRAAALGIGDLYTEVLQDPSPKSIKW